MKKLLLLLSLVTLLGCGEDGPGDGGVNDGDREAMLRALATNVIVPGFAEVLTKAQALESSVNALNANPNKQTIEAAQTAWKELGKSWKRVEFYQQGLLDQERPDSLIYKIDIGAADMSQRAVAIHGSLSTAINTDKIIDVNYVEGLPAIYQGIPAIEHILFDTAPLNAIAALTTGPDAAKRRAYLTALVTNLRARFAMVHESWSESGGNFQQSFINAFGTDLGSSLGMLINDVVSLAESMKNEKVARPLGLFNSNSPRPDSVEARWSSQSTFFLLENVNGIEQMFTADAGGRTGIGIDSLLNSLDAKVGETNVSTAVLDQLQKIRERITTINQPLPDAIRAGDQNVKELYEDCRVLLKLLKVDVVSQLGVMITTLEGDGD